MKKTQLSLPVIFVLLLIVILQLVLALFNPQHTILFLSLLIIPVIIFILFYQLVVSIDSEKIELWFGIGLIRKVFKIESIKTVTTVKNSATSGFGIREGEDYTLYNASGLQAIELTFKNSSEKVRIGTDNPEELQAFINQFLY